MKRIVLLNLCLILVTTSVFAADGVTQEVDKICRFTFPTAPIVTESHGHRDYFSETDSCSYLVQVEPAIRKIVIFDTTSLYRFYSTMVSGILQGYHATLIGEKHINIKGLRLEEFEYLKKDPQQHLISISARILFLNGRFIIYSFQAPNGRFMELKYIKDRFFASLAVAGDIPLSQLYNESDSIQQDQTKSDITTIPTPTYDSVASHLPATAVHTELVKRNTLYFIISFAVSISLLAGILYILVRWRKKNKN
jgi:hypothetical protein